MDPFVAFATGIAASLILGLPGSWYFVKRHRLKLANGTSPTLEQAVTAASHKITEEITQQTEEQFCTLLHTMAIPIWLRDPDLNVVFVNHAAQNSDGLIDYAHGLATRALETGEPQKEARMLTSNGQRRVMEITETPLESGMGGTDEAGTIGICIEQVVSAAHNPDQPSGRSIEQATYGRMIEALHAGIAIYGADKRLRNFNAAFANMWSLDAVWLEQSPTITQISERLRDERRLPEVSNFTEFRSEESKRFTSQTATSEDTLYLPDGRALRLTIAPGVADTVNAARGLTYIYEDITGALTIQRSYKSLDAVQRQTIDNLQESVALFGSDGRLKLHNASFAALWALPDNALESELHLSDVVEYMRDPDENNDVWTARRAKIMANLTHRQKHQDRIRRPDGKVYDLSCVPLSDGALLISYQDVTEEAEVERALQERAEILEETDRLKSKFIADVSYEARTPLTTISGFAQIMNGEYFGELNTRQKEYMNGILQTADNLQLVIADILELAAIESGAASLEKDAIDLHNMLFHSLELFSEHARTKSLYMDFIVPIDIGWISADEKRLKQVVFNLLSNAIRFTPNHGGVQLSAERNDDGIKIIVSDSGTGIPKADLDRFWQKFQKGEQPEGDPGGAGLGLALVKSFIELHGGTVSIISPRNRGTRVTCFLPATGTEGGDARNAFDYGED